MTNQASSLAWQQLVEAGLYERHFNQIQGTYRALTSTWLLATFIGLGFILVNGKNLPIDALLVGGGIGLLGAAGIALLWNLDLRVYHRLLDVVFLTARRIEKAHPELPPYRIQMLATGGVVRRVVWFYVVATDVLLLVATLSVAFDVWRRGWALWWVAVVGIGVMLVTLAAIAMRAASIASEEEVRRLCE